jgi:uncharacterized protein YdgA (DUF945 family)
MVQELLSQGMKPEEVAQYLLAQGMSEEDVNTLFQQISESEPQQEKE